jgi:tetratricopeptide (TPR) repeat protein
VSARTRRAVVVRVAVALTVMARAVGLACPALAAEPTAARPGERRLESFRRALEIALEQYRERRFAAARAAFEKALALAPEGDGRDNIEFDIAACDYELGDFRAAELRFARLGAQASGARAEALLHAGWAALARGDVDRAARYLAGSAGDAALTDKRKALADGIDARRLALDAQAFDAALEQATAAYDRGDLRGAEAGVSSARLHELNAKQNSRAALDYLAGLLARERGDDDAARRALERSLSENPADGAVQALLGELAQANGDSEAAERHYRASLAAELSPSEASAVRDALDALYPVPPVGFAAWAVLGAGYDSNATQSGSSDAVGYASPNARGSPFAAPALGLEYRFPGGQHTRLVTYYAGDWLLLSDAAVEDASLQSHEAGVRLHFAPSPRAELRFSAAGGVTLSGLALSPFSLDGVLRGRAALRHGSNFQSALLLEARPSLGLSGRGYLTGTRSDVSLGERFESGPWGASVSLGFRYNGIGTQLIDINPVQYPNCNVQCVGARYEIPLGYSGPSVGVDGDVDATRRLSFAGAGKYEHRTYLAESRIDGPMFPGLFRELSEKTRVDDRYTLSARARYRFDSAPELGVFLDYTLRISQSNVAFRRDLEHAFDYDDRNFTQHILELGLDVRR